MNLAEIKFSFARNGSSGGSVDLGEVWDALGSVCDTLEALTDKLTGASTHSTLNPEEETGTEIEYAGEEGSADDE